MISVLKGRPQQHSLTKEPIMYILHVTSPHTAHPHVTILKELIQPLDAYKFLKVTANHLFTEIVEDLGEDNFSEDAFNKEFDGRL